MKMKKLLTLLLVFAMAAALFAGCNGKPEATEPTATTDTTTAPTEDDGENYDTGDASLDNPRNQDEIGENELLVVSFGTSYNDNRRLTIGAIEAAMEKAFPEYSVRRGFTSQIIIDHVKDRDGEIIDNVGEALDRAVANGVKNLVIQPTHLMNGLEYNDLVNEVAQYSDAFESVAIGLPLLTSDEDFQIVADAIVKATASYDDGKTAICFMGHGTEAESNAVYAKMQQVLTEGGHANYFVGTVEATPSLEDVLALVQAGSYERVVLQPLMIVAGDHANNDMAGDEEGSWKTTFEAAGYQVECLVNGLGELEEIQNLLVAHAQAAMAGEEDEENYETGDASLDNPRNQDEIGESELLVVSFGTSYNDNRRLTIGAIEAAMEKAFPEYSVRRGFTSQIIIDHVKDRDGEVIDNVGEALDRAVANGVKNLVIQPTHLMNGLEYSDLVNEVAQYSDAFEAVSIGEPLLTSDEDFQAVADAIVEATASYDDGKTAICFMGHGTEADSNAVYAKMQQLLTDGGHENYFVGTVEATPSLEDVLALVQAGSYERVVLQPLMIVAGDHANNDMAGDEEGSWKTTFEAAGYQVECLVNGLGELEAVQNLLVAHAQAAIDALN
ncbi:MAG: sirohydrochlorin cobaltochelatase [Oscillospiraceae bacterium]